MKTLREMPASYDPYGDVKVYHFASLINNRGGVSALCYERPRAIKLGKNLWTLRKEDVTCKKCLAKLEELSLGITPTPETSK